MHCQFWGIRYRTIVQISIYVKEKVVGHNLRIYNCIVKSNPVKIRRVGMKKMKIEAVYRADSSSKCPRPLFVGTVSAGFPSPAEDYVEGQLDLNKHLIKRPAATYFVRVTGDSMIEAGIHSGDLLVVDRSVEPQDKNVVIANINGELTVKRIRLQNGRVTLRAENENYPPRQINRPIDFEIWGVVKHVIHSL